MRKFKKFKARILYGGCKADVTVKATKKIQAKKHILSYFKNSKIITIDPVVYSQTL